MSKRRVTINAAAGAVRGIVSDLVGEAGQEVKARAYRTANELQNQLNNVMRGERSGRRYIIPGTGRMTYRKGKRQAVGLSYDHVNKKAKLVYGNPDATAKIAYKYYTASAPGEPPAIRTGAFRLSWHRRTYAEQIDGQNFNVHGVTESDLRVGKHLLGNILEEGTGRMAPRPYKQRVIDAAMPKVKKIYSEPYFRR